MAKLEEVLPALRAGKTEVRWDGKRWLIKPAGQGYLLCSGETSVSYWFPAEFFDGDSWEIIEDKPHELLKRRRVDELALTRTGYPTQTLAQDWLVLHDAVLAARRLCSRESTEAWDDLVKALRVCGSLPD